MTSKTRVSLVLAAIALLFLIVSSAISVPLAEAVIPSMATLIAVPVLLGLALIMSCIVAISQCISCSNRD